MLGAEHCECKKIKGLVPQGTHSLFKGIAHMLVKSDQRWLIIGSAFPTRHTSGTVEDSRERSVNRPG